MPQYTVLKHSSGKRQTYAIDGRTIASPGKLAKQTGLAETTAREVISGKTRKGWTMETMQRRRECMRISYKLTAAGKHEAFTRHVTIRKGRENIEKPYSAFQVFLQNIEKGEASDISESMQAAGFPAWNRQRVLIEGVAACKAGYATQSKLSGAIFCGV